MGIATSMVRRVSSEQKFTMRGLWRARSGTARCVKTSGFLWLGEYEFTRSLWTERPSPCLPTGGHHEQMRRARLNPPSSWECAPG